MVAKEVVSVKARESIQMMLKLGFGSSTEIEDSWKKFSLNRIEENDSICCKMSKFAETSPHNSISRFKKFSRIKLTKTEL